MHMLHGSLRQVLPVLYCIALAIGYFGWLYYREWRFKRHFHRYWDTKSKKTPSPQLSPAKIRSKR
jgi:hypothetical protein